MLSLLLVLAVADPAIVIAPVRTRLVSGRLDLAKACGSALWIYGCTKFLGEKLSCTCESDEGKWSIHASAQFIPYMYLWQPVWIPHENLHIADIRGWLDDYLKQLQSKSYSSVDDCISDAQTESTVFTKRMNAWKRASNLKRHPGQKGERPSRPQSPGVSPGDQ